MTWLENLKRTAEQRMSRESTQVQLDTHAQEGGGVAGCQSNSSEPLKSLDRDRFEIGDWAVLNAGGERLAVYRRKCRHLRADLANGEIDG